MRQRPTKQHDLTERYGEGEAALSRACGPGLDFMTSYGAQRAGDYGDAPDFFPASPGPDADEETDADSENDDDSDDNRAAREWGLEIAPELWSPIPVGETLPRCDEPRPVRFVDGKDVGRVVAYIAAPQGFIVPVRLAQIGAIALQGASREADALSHPQGLFCESRRAERVVSFMADLFPWDEVERYAAALQAGGFRLLISSSKIEASEMRNIPRLRESVRARTREEMFHMEREAIVNSGFCEEVITIADGLLDDKQEGLRGNPAVAGVIKSHSNRSYLREPLWDTFYALEAGERTPIIAFTAKVSQQATLTWYLRLVPRTGDPMAGVIRVEILRSYFDDTLRGDFSYITRLSAFLIRARTRDRGYGRAAVTLYPIQRAEDSLGACFCDRQRCDAEFYRLNGL